MNRYKDEKLVRFIHSHPSFPWNFRQLSMHPNLTLRVLQEFPTREWDFYLISYSKNFKWEWVQAMPNKQWHWNLFAFHEDFSWKWIQEFPDKQWDWRCLSHMVTDVGVIREFSEKPWDWSVLTLSTATKLTFMMETPEYPWNVRDLFFAKIDDEETIKFITMFANVYDEEDWEDHTRHATWRAIKTNMSLPWGFRHIYFKPGEFEESDVRYLIEKPDQWNMEHISKVADYTTVIKPHPEIKWNIKSLSRNPTFFSSDLPKDIEGFNLNYVHIKDDMREWYAAQTIKRYWKRAITDPSRSICRNVFLKYMNCIVLNRVVTTTAT